MSSSATLERVRLVEPELNQVVETRLFGQEPGFGLQEQPGTRVALADGTGVAFSRPVEIYAAEEGTYEVLRHGLRARVKSKELHFKDGGVVELSRLLSAQIASIIHLPGTELSPSMKDTLPDI